ncbi:hypothetical protein Lal_00008199 [Lupinus albus]|nr:hypothetical protein Lal_00008199 [Lupinus albus]
MTSKDLLVPWSFLGGLDDIVKDKPNIIQKPSFAQTVRGTCEVPISLLPKPCLKGDVVAVKIPEAAYQAGLQRCKTHLHGRFILTKGDKPMKFADLKTRLLDLWSMVGKWNMISLGRGFYEFAFSSVEDMRVICATSSWNLKPGILRLSLWTPDFSHGLQKITHSQCWIKITGLPQEYWCPSVIFTIAGGIGTPISIDEATTNRSFGHFARVLVDINLKNSVPNQVLVERDGFEFFVCIQVENMPAFCTGCQTIGHVVSKCRRSSKVVVDEVAKPMARKSKPLVVEPTGLNLVIDLDIEDVNTQGMGRLILNPEDSHKLGHEAARDMAIVGRLWDENEEDEVSEEEESFTQMEQLMVHLGSLEEAAFIKITNGNTWEALLLSLGSETHCVQSYRQLSWQLRFLSKKDGGISGLNVTRLWWWTYSMGNGPFLGG